jgi:UDP-N-acetyl-D-galactosamine dehydrogenase
MVTYQDIRNNKMPISVIGLGYVGLPVAVAFASKVKVIGFDVNADKIGSYKKGIDSTGEVGDDVLKKTTVRFTSNPTELQQAKFHIVAVPTPVREDKTPDLSSLENACELLGENLSSGSVVVFESTVYPGVTEEICAPILERISGLTCGADFKVGYSPERINPGDKTRRLESIVKVVAGMDAETLELTAQVYGLVVDAGIYRAPSIKVAEAAKVIENSQRDVNIAFVNELAIIFNRLGIDTKEVLKAAGTKWNFLNFTPGLVGGHCIGVDPYYLTYRASQLGYHPQVILAGREINDGMGRFVAECTVKKLVRNGMDISKVKTAVLGLTFKEDCPDTRNTRVIDVINELKSYGIVPDISDPVANQREVIEHYGITLTPMEDIKNVDCLIVAVAHKVFYKINLDEMLTPGGILVDVKGIFDSVDVINKGYEYWQL